MSHDPGTSPRTLVVVLGDQLNDYNYALSDADPDRDAVWMAEVEEESTRVRSHKARIAYFLSAMRHFRDLLRKRGFTVHYRTLDDAQNKGSLAEELRASIAQLKPERLAMLEPDEWRLDRALRKVAKETGIELEVETESNFLCSREEFEEHAEGRKQLRMEFFYREMRKRHNYLMDGDRPAGGQWNLDEHNREAFDQDGPEDLSRPMSFSRDKITDEVIALVEKRFPDHPGSLKPFDYPVTETQAFRALSHFVKRQLRRFGRYQDAMWTGEPWLHHSRLSAAINLQLLHPCEVLDAVHEAWREDKAPLNSVEGYIRQVLGWREFVRGIYWRFMPDYLDYNALEADGALPWFYWTGETDMVCLRETIGQTLEYGYAHHIQRLMVTGLFALLLGVRPQKVHEWYLAIYVDAVEWVELPNTLGMSQFGDGGIMASKPYVATGKYIQRMSNYCEHCRYDPEKSTGEKACPFTTLYWDFLMRHAERLKDNARMKMQLRNLERLDPERCRAIRREADAVRSRLTG